MGAAALVSTVRGNGHAPGLATGGAVTTPRPEGQEEGADTVMWEGLQLQKGGRLQQRTQAPPALSLAGRRQQISTPTSKHSAFIPPTAQTPWAARERRSPYKPAFWGRDGSRTQAGSAGGEGEYGQPALTLLLARGVL